MEMLKLGEIHQIRGRDYGGFHLRLLFVATHPNGRSPEAKGPRHQWFCESLPYK